MDTKDINNNFYNDEPQRPFNEKQVPSSENQPSFSIDGFEPKPVFSQETATQSNENSVDAFPNVSGEADENTNDKTVQSKTDAESEFAKENVSTEPMSNEQGSADGNAFDQRNNPYSPNYTGEVNRQNNAFNNQAGNQGFQTNAQGGFANSQPAYYQQGYYNQPNAGYQNSAFNGVPNYGAVQPPMMNSQPTYQQYVQPYVEPNGNAPYPTQQNGNQPQQNGSQTHQNGSQTQQSGSQQYSAPQNNGYVQPPFNGYQQQPPVRYYYPPDMKSHPNDGFCSLQNPNVDAYGNFRDAYSNPQQFAQVPVKPPKKKKNAGLIVIIVLLSTLLVGSIAGLFAYSVFDKMNDSSAPDNIFEMIKPDNDKKEEDNTNPSTSPNSDKNTDKGYNGIELEDKPSDASTNKNYTAATAFNKVSNSVVGILCYQKGTEEITDDKAYDSQGSGIVLTSDGYIVTNSHVINNSKTDYLIYVVTANGEKYSANVVGYDSRTDIAVLKAKDVNNLSPATFGDSDKIELGEEIIAVGNPGGLDYQNSITKGIVSATDRKLSSTSLVKYIQTDAAINPGNSGGPIVNRYGQVIGIATAKIVTQNFEGMGFAIPSQTAKGIIDSLIQNGYVKGRVKIGIVGVAIDSATAKQENVPQGIVIKEISKGGPCDGSGIQVGDILTKADGKEVTSFSEIYEILENHKPNDKIEIEYFCMKDQKTKIAKITLQEDIT